MCIGKQIDNFWQARINQTRNVIDDYNRLQIEVGKLESVSGFSIESLIKMFAEGYELKKNSRKEAGRVKRYASGYWYQFIIPRRLTLPPVRIYRWLNFYWRLKDKEE